MKIINSKTFIILLSFIAAIGCKKEMENESLNNLQQQEDPVDFRSGRCLLTYSDDQVFGETLSLTYNQRQNPETVQLSALGSNTLIGKYDHRGRLKQIFYSSWQDREDFVYSNNSDLPAKIYYYVPDYATYGMTDSLNAILSFKYNAKGEMTQFKLVNYWYPNNNYVVDYTYDHQGNLVLVNEKPLVPSGFINQQYRFFAHDRKPNILHSNPWLKYFLLSQSVDAFGSISMLSVNNPLKYGYKYDPSLPGFLLLNTAFDYNPFGFANSITTNIYDSSSNTVYTAYRNSTSTCDGNCANRQPEAMPLTKLPALKSRSPFLIHPLKK